MPVRSDYLLRSQVYRSPQRLGSIGHPQDLSFLDRPWYYEEADNTWGGRNAEIEKWERSYESDDTLDYESENTLVGGGEVEEKDSLELFVNPAKKYSLHILVTAIVLIFLLEIPLRLPFALASFLAIPSIDMLLTPQPGTLLPPDVLLRRPSLPGAQPKTTIPGTLLSIPLTTPGKSFFTRSTYLPRSSERIAFLRRQHIVHTTFLEPPYLAKRTYTESWADLHIIPRFRAWAWASFKNIVWYQLCFRAFGMVPYVIRFVVTGEYVNHEVWLWNVYRFWYDWVVGLSGVAWRFVSPGPVREVFVGWWDGVKAVFGTLWAWAVGWEEQAGQWAHGRGAAGAVRM